MKVIATITSKFSSGYTAVPVKKVMDYDIDSAMDTDADSFTVDIGDPSGQLAPLFARDSEIRIALSGVINSRIMTPLLKGYVDTANLSDDGTLTLTGRDLSAAPVDDTAIPENWYYGRPDRIIASQARQRGFSRFSIIPLSPITHIYTDGSESVWAFWYRMVRIKHLWIWVDADGTLWIDHLNYASAPSYYFGWPTKAKPNVNQWINVISAAILKDTKTRIWQVWVFGDTGMKPFTPVKITDKRLDGWIKRPISIVSESSSITTQAEAIRQANEDIFEGIVGELEITIQISAHNQIIKQNKICFLNIPEMGISGEYFIVGVHQLGNTSGLIQELRLREKKYALTQVIPSSPDLDDTSDDYSPSTLGKNLGITYAQYYVVAAQAFAGTTGDFDRFLAAIMSIGQQEGNRNVRETADGYPSDIEWFPEPTGTGAVFNFSGTGFLSGTLSKTTGKPVAEVQQWKADFANSVTNPLNPFYPNGEAGVGPMQLTSAGLKDEADTRGGKIGEYDGGRWDPAANIFIGAQYFNSFLQGTPRDEPSYWIAMAKYNGGEGEWQSPAAQAYMKRVRQTYVTMLSNIDTTISSTKTTPVDSTYTGLNLPTGTPRQVRLILNYLIRQEGQPYVWGGGNCTGATTGVAGDSADPDAPNTVGFDCSGLAQAAYGYAGFCKDINGQNGKQSTNDLYDLASAGTGTLELIKAYDQILPGDMVFFQVGDTGTPPQHMGVAIGNGQMIVAPHSGKTVTQQSIREGGLTFMAAARIKGLWPAPSNNQSQIYLGNH